MIKKPEPYYKSISDMRQKCVQYSSVSHKLSDLSWFPCLKCKGHGRVYDSNDCDPVEGYKMATKYPCKTCNGTGTGSKKLFTEEYKVLKKDYINKLKKYKSSISRIKEIKKILTDSDMELISRYKHYYSYDY